MKLKEGNMKDITTTEELLQTLPSQDGLQIEYKGKLYYRPYQTFEFKGETFEGLREMTKRKELFIDLINKHVVQKDSYLDIGCNMGYFVKNFSTIFQSVTGIDYNSYYTWFAKTVYPDIAESYYNYDINSYGLSSFFGNKRFNFITSLSMIEYIVDKKKFVEDIYGLLKPGGFVIFEGHSMDINLGHDVKYEDIIKSLPWAHFERLVERTDNGINAPSAALGRPIWICKKGEDK